MQGRQRESVLLVMVMVGTGAVLLAALAGVGVWFLRRRPRRALDAGEMEPLPGSPAAEA
jgi:hypothetical protein